MRDTYKAWNHKDRAWANMRSHESHEEGGFGVTLNTVSRHAASYQCQVSCGHLCPQQVWLPGNDLQDPSTRDAAPVAR